MNRPVYRPVDRAVILAAGSASRMQQGLERYISDGEELRAIQKGEKMAARFGRFPFLDYQILNLIQSGITEINIVLKPDDVYFQNRYRGVGRQLFPEGEISFSFQEVADGTAHALLAAEAFVGQHPFFLLNGDNHYSREALSMLRETPPQLSGIVAFDVEGFNQHTRERVESFAVIQTYEGKLTRIVEKAAEPGRFMVNDELYTGQSDRRKVRGRVLTSMNLWCFNAEIVEMCRSVPRHMPRKPGKAGEFELPDAVQLLMEHGREIRVFYACEDVLDLTRPEDIAAVGQRIEKTLLHEIDALESRWARVGSH
jgi:glucose-1-phosphate thymidylyltransferase